MTKPIEWTGTDDAELSGLVWALARVLVPVARSAEFVHSLQRNLLNRGMTAPPTATARLRQCVNITGGSLVALATIAVYWLGCSPHAAFRHGPGCAMLPEHLPN